MQRRPCRARSAGRIANNVAFLGANHADHEFNNCPRGEELANFTSKGLAQEALKGTAAKVTVLDEKKMQVLKMGAILGVGKGAEAKPKFIIIEYFNGPKSEKPVVLVGKGVTFDTGGLNLKGDITCLA